MFDLARAGQKRLKAGSCSPPASRRIRGDSSLQFLTRLFNVGRNTISQAERMFLARWIFAQHFGHV
jgi:hypothetical protein